MKTTHQKRKGFTLVELLVVIAIIVALAALAVPAVMQARKKGDLVTTTNNAKQIHAALLNFNEDYGNFPDDETRNQDADVQNAPAGQTSNAYLSQLIFGNAINSEEIFFAKGGANRNKQPDGIFGFNNIQETLEAGECGFAYIMVEGGSGSSSGLRGQSLSDNGNRIVLAAPMLDETTFKFDPYDGKAVVLRIDSSVKSLKISRQNNTVSPPGAADRTIFDSGEDSVWGANITPQVQLPE